MAHRVLNSPRRHHNLLNRQFVLPGFGGNDDDDDVPTTRPVPTPDPVVTRPPATTVNTGPTAGPIINRPPVDTQPAVQPTPQVAPPPAQATTSQVAPPAQAAPATTQQTTQAAPVPATTSTPATSAVLTSTKPSTVINSLTVSRSASSSAALSSSSASPSGSGSSVGPIIGGVAAGIAGVAIIVFAITYFLRRRRAKQYEQDAFDASQFRRSAVLMDDPPTHDDTVARGFNPPPMAQSYGGNEFGGYGAPPPVTYGNMGRGALNEYDAQQNTAGFGAAGQSRWSDLSPPPSAQPLMVTNGPYGHPSPLPSPISTVSPYESVYNQTGLGGASPISPPPNAARGSVQTMGSANLARQPSGATLDAYPPVGVAMTRDGSIRGPQEAPGSPDAQYATYGNYPVLNNMSPRHSVPMPNNDYVELNRSSVTPFQAAQYQAISNKLNAPVPKGLDTPIVEEHVQKMSGPPPALPEGPMPSPFDDPADAAADLPAPPPPVAARRIDSTPPMLPEIHVQSRITSMNGADAFPATPSPMALEQTFPTTPSADHSTFSHTPVKQSFDQPPMPVAQRQQEQSGKRPDTVYDPEDAYGGM